MKASFSIERRAVLLALMSGPLLATAAVGAEAGAKVTGPIVGGSPGRAWTAPTFDIERYGYVVEEYFLESIATAYDLAPGVSQTPDGKWRITRRDPAPFKSRILVVRPVSNALFNGTVVVNWQNVTAGFEGPSLNEGELLRGYAWVGVSAQKIGIDGFAGPNPQGLKAADPQRYDSLSHPGDDYSFDIFTQAARIVGKDRKPQGVDPMGGLAVKRLIATGASQSASRLRAYINGVHPIEKAFDGYVPVIDWSTQSRFRELPSEIRTGASLSFDEMMARPRTHIREDLDTPVFVVNTETEARIHFDSRQADTATYRFWEIAGASHGSVPLLLLDTPEAARRPGTRLGGLDHPNWISYVPVYEAALRHMHIWLSEGRAPPAAPKIAVTAGSSPVIQRDVNGNAIGGIRLPEFVAVIAEHRGEGKQKPGGGKWGHLVGYSNPHSPERLRAAYASASAYMAVYDDAMNRCVSAGYLLPEDAPRFRQTARTWAARLG